MGNGRQGLAAAQKEWRQDQVNPADHEVEQKDNSQVDQVESFQTVKQDAQREEQCAWHQPRASHPPASAPSQLPVAQITDKVDYWEIKRRQQSPTQQQRQHGRDQ